MSDDESRARGWLASVEAPPSRLEVTGIVLTGRAQARRRRYLAAGGATAVVLAVAAALPVAVQGWRAGPGLDPPPGGASPLPALECETTELELPDHPERGTPNPSHVSVRAMDPTGRYVLANWVSGEVTGTDDPSVAVLWDTEDGSATYLPTLQGGASGQAVNARGAVVGSDWDDEGEYPWIYRDGDLDALPVPAGYQGARAEGVNVPGDVVGTASDPSGASVVVIWPAEDADQPRVLGAPDGWSYVTPAGITDDGTVVAGGDRGPYRWDPDGAGNPLPLPEGATVGGVTAVRGASAVGGVTLPASAAGVEVVPVAGYSEDLASIAPSPPPEREQLVEVPVAWDLRTDTVEVLGPGVASRAGVEFVVAVSAAGDLVLSHTLPVVVRDGRPYTLPVPVEGGHPQPRAVSEDGTVFAGAVETDAPDGGDPVSVPTVWRCR